MFCVHSGCPASPLPMVARWIFRTPAADGLVHGQTVWLQWLPGSFTTCFLHLYPSDLTSCPTSFHTSTWASCGSLTMTEEIIFHCKLFQDIEHSSLCYTGSPCHLFYVCVYVLRPTLLWLQGLSYSKLLCLWDFLGKNTGVGCHALLQRMFLGLLHCRHILYQPSHQGSPLLH